MGIEERRARERERRQRDILDAAWAVAHEVGWAGFSVERVAAKAELGRATVYGYFESLEALVEAMAEEAVSKLGDRVAAAQGLPEALDAPLRFSQANPAAFALLFQENPDPRPAFTPDNLAEPRREARALIGTLRRLAERSGASLPEDAAAAQAFLAGISIAGAVVPELRSSTPLRRKWQDFCLTVGTGADALPEARPHAGAPTTKGRG